MRSSNNIMTSPINYLKTASICVTSPNESKINQSNFKLDTEN
jgi:hypothetical protein